MSKKLVLGKGLASLIGPDIVSSRGSNEQILPSSPSSNNKPANPPIASTVNQAGSNSEGTPNSSTIKGNNSSTSNLLSTKLAANNMGGVGGTIRERLERNDRAERLERVLNSMEKSNDKVERVPERHSERFPERTIERPTERAIEELGGPVLVDVTAISVNPFQPRKVFDEKEIEELGNSIKENGLIQPLIVAKIDNGFELIAGERRWRACKLIGLKKVPVIVKRVTDREKLVMAIIENVQRANLNCVEEACAYYQLMEDFRLTQEEVAKKVGKERSTVANFLRILNLPPSVLEMLQRETLTLGHAKLLVGVKEHDKIEKMAREVVDKSLSVRELENLIKIVKPSPNGGKNRPPRSEFDDRLDQLRSEIEKRTGFHVLISKKDNQSGSISIKYNSMEGFNQIYDFLLK